MANYIMMPNGSAKTTTVKVNGRTYSCALGSTVTVPDFDAPALSANGWITFPGTAGTTAQRPTKTPDGQPLPVPTIYNDTTLGYGVIWDGVNWRHPQSGATV